MIWVPSHVIDHSHMESAENLKKLINESGAKGWYCFCGRTCHIPRGMPFWFGEERNNGKLVERIGDHQKLNGFEFFTFWHVGIVEAGIEKRWEQTHFEPSCEYGISLRLAYRFSSESSQEELVKKFYDKILSLVTSKKKSFSLTSYEDFKKFVRDEQSLKGLSEYLCSRCKVVPCLNRLVPYYDKREFKKLVTLSD